MTANDAAVPGPLTEAGDAALQHGSWRGFYSLSSTCSGLLDEVERFLDEAGFDRGPWLAVGLAGGMAAWFTLANRWQWLALLAGCFGTALLAAWAMSRVGRYPFLRQAIVAMSLAIAAGCGVVWLKSALVGTPPISGFTVADLQARVLERQDEPARDRIRLILATHEPRTGRAIKVRLTLPEAADRPGLGEGAAILVRARLMPPRPPQLPGGYDFARAAWFDGLAATGSALGPPAVLHPADTGEWLARSRHALADHVRNRISGSAGGIAAAFASGDRGGIAPKDDQAMRDAGLTHLLSVSGLHVAAVVGLAYALVLRLLALSPWLALRVRLPLVASTCGALSGVGYTLLTGAEVPTVRSCFGALLAMAALALGRNPLNMRLLATAALAIMLAWPEAVVSPGFQMSFGSVIAIIAVSQCAPVQAFLAHRGESALVRAGRHLVVLLLTGMVIDLALMPIALYHFHRAGLYGSLANVLAIPLTTFVTMPLIALALALDVLGAGGPVWSLVGLSLRLLLALAHGTAGLPGAVSLVPANGSGAFVLSLCGMLWLALWHGRVRLLGLVPVALALATLAGTRPPDLLVTGDGRNLGITDRDSGQLLILREGRTAFTRDAMLGLAGITGEVRTIDTWPGAQCNRDACLVTLARADRLWRILVLRRDGHASLEDIERACAAADIVIAPGKLGSDCRPASALVDKILLQRTGGLAFDLVDRTVRTVADDEGEHPGWRFPHRLPRAAGARPNQPSTPSAESTPKADPDEAADADPAQ